MAKIKKSQACLKHHLHKITIFDRQRALKISPSTIEQVVLHLMERYKVRAREIAIHFVSRQEIQALHKRFFNDPTATDCITLPMNPPDEESDLLGELFVCPEVARTYAKKHGEDPQKEMLLYVIHGFLHLMGFEDKTAEGKRRMRREETKCLDFVSSLQYIEFS